MWLENYGRGIGQGEYATIPEAGFRIRLRFGPGQGEQLLFQYRAIDAPLLVLHNLPPMVRYGRPIRRKSQR